MNDFNESAVEDLREDIKNEFNNFLKNSESNTNKAGARRARKNTRELATLMKKYRKISIK